MPVKLGELLLEENRITGWQLQQARNDQNANGGTLARAMARLGIIKDEEVASILARRYGVPQVDLLTASPEPHVIDVIPPETARKYRVLPLAIEGKTLTIAMDDPTNVFAMDDIKFTTGYTVEPVVAPESALDDLLERYYGPRQAVGRPAEARRTEESPLSLPNAPRRLQSPGWIDSRNWKRGAFRLYLVLAVVFVAWATWREIGWNNLALRKKNIAWCDARYLKDVDFAIGFFNQRSLLDGAKARRDKCIEGMIEGTPHLAERIAKDPKGAALAEARILIIPVICWWILRGLVEVSLWIVRGFRGEERP